MADNNLNKASQFLIRARAEALPHQVDALELLLNFSHLQCSIILLCSASSSFLNTAPCVWAVITEAILIQLCCLPQPKCAEC